VFQGAFCLKRDAKVRAFLKLTNSSKLFFQKKTTTHSFNSEFQQNKNFIFLLPFVVK